MIRKTPDKIEHCVAWGRHFFNLVFGKQDDDENVLSDLEVPRWSSTQSESATDYAWRLYEWCFCSDIQKEADLIAKVIAEKKTSRKAPRPVAGFSRADAESATAHD